MLVIKTKEELKRAIENKTSNFIVEGELAEEIHKARKVSTMGAATLGILTTAVAGIALTPATGGISGALGLTTAAGIAALTGMEIATISIIASIVAIMGVSLFISLYKDYDIEFETDLDIPKGKVKAKFNLKK